MLARVVAKDMCEGIVAIEQSARQPAQKDSGQVALEQLPIAFLGGPQLGLSFQAVADIAETRQQAGSLSADHICAAHCFKRLPVSQLVPETEHDGVPPAGIFKPLPEAYQRSFKVFSMHKVKA